MAFNTAAVAHGRHLCPAHGYFVTPNGDPTPLAGTHRPSPRPRPPPVCFLSLQIYLCLIQMSHTGDTWCLLSTVSEVVPSALQGNQVLTPLNS